MGKRADPKQSRSIRSIDTIFSVAQGLVARDGRVSFTAAELAEAAGMSIGRIYYWFQTSRL